MRGVGSAAAAAAGAAKAARTATPAKYPERGRQSLKNCVNWLCQELDKTPRSILAVACGTIRVCACLVCAA